MATPDQVAARRKLGNELRRLRVDRERSGAEVAEELGWNQSKVSRIERAQTMAQLEDVVALLDCYGIAAAERAELLPLAAESIGGPGEWRNSTRSGLARRQADFIALERSARTIRHYQPLFIPGYMQFEPYARSIIEMAGARDVDRALAFRLARRETMTAPHGPAYAITLMESALHWRPVEVGDMAAQLALTLELAQRSNVSLRIVPFSERQSSFIQHPLMIFDFEGDTPTEALVETTTADHRITDPKPIEALSTFFERVTSSALSESASMALIQRIMTALQSGQTD
ncbi:helix-turn-helix transcriptional regulator [Phytomonospora sp. NPDC050363]|uniref:helix-turn-helix domain-containing protein n=1 Tax=Phytomonospora sp. NPDC050363 TaxID=3155642 RepID=UPI00340B9661